MHALTAIPNFKLLTITCEDYYYTENFTTGQAITKKTETGKHEVSWR